jgi:hypothetical protein
MKLHPDPDNPTILLDEDDQPVTDTGVQGYSPDGGFSVNTALAAEIAKRWNAGEP